MVAEVVKLADEDPAFRNVIEAVVRDNLGPTISMPELLSTMLGVWEYDREMWLEVERLRIEEDLDLKTAEGAAFLTHGPIADVVETLYTNINPELDRSAALAMEADKNLSILLTDTSPMLTADMADLHVGMFSAMPDQMSTAGDIVSRDHGPTAAGGIFGFFDQFSTAPGQISEQLTDPRYFRNIREETATEALEWLSENPLETDADQRRYFTWLYMTAKQKIREVESGGTSGFGQALNVLDIPKHGATAGVNHLFYGIASPNDHFDRTSMSLGKNWAITSGTNPGDDQGSSFLRHPIAHVLTKPIQYGVNIAIPAVGVFSAARTLFTGEGAVQTPLVGGLIQGLEEGNSYQAISGTADLLTWFGLDPLNWAAGAGFGAKQTTNIFRAPGLSKARAIFESVKPFYGVRTIPVRGGMLSRVVWAVSSQSADDALRQAPKTAAGKRIFRIFQEAESAEDAIRKVPSLNAQQADRLILAAADGQDSFWARIRLDMTGPDRASSGPARHVAASVLQSQEYQIAQVAQEHLREGRLSIRQVAHGVFGSTDEVYASLDNGVHKVSLDIEDGVEKVVIDSRKSSGWQSIDIATPDVAPLIQHLAETDPELAAKIMMGADGTLGRLSPSETRKIQDYLTNSTNAHAVRLGDETLFAPRAERHILRGQDIVPPGAIEDLMETDLHHAAIAFSARKTLDQPKPITLIHRLPSPSNTATLKANVARWTRLDGTSRVAQWARKTGAGLQLPAPKAVDFADEVGGAEDFRTVMRFLGVSKPTRDRVMTEYTAALTNEGRRKVFFGSLEELGKEIKDPILRYELYDFYNRHGEHGYSRSVAHGGESTMGVQRDVGTPHPVAPLKSLMIDSVPIPNLHAMQRTGRRYAMGSKFPRLTSGFGGTNKRRVALAEAYRHRLHQTLGPKEAAKITDDELLTMAYADVLGFDGRPNGLGLANQMWKLPAKGYGMFHTTFTFAQLALRPFAWATRVNLEEHSRAWFMGLPTLLRSPTAYMAGRWDAKFLMKRPKLYARQAAAAIESSDAIWRGPGTFASRVAAAEEIMPGFGKLLRDRNITNASTARALYVSRLTDQLKGGIIPEALGRSDNITRSVLARAEAITVHNKLLEQRYAIDADFNILDDVPEITNKLATLLFADELAASYQRMSFSARLRSRDVHAYSKAWLTKASQFTQDQGGKYAVKRMLERSRNGGVTEYTAARFARYQYWDDLRPNAQEIADYRNLSFASDEAMAAWYLDEVIGEDLIDNHFRGLWGNNPPERERILEDLVDGHLHYEVDGRSHNFSIHRNDYGDSSAAAGALFDDLYRTQNFQFPDVVGAFNPMYANHDTKTVMQQVRRFANGALQVFGENVSQNLHRRPSYLNERRRWMTALQNLGWDEATASAYAHRQAYQFVNWTFFNNQHVGSTTQRLNKIVPFFSAWAEVLGTWAYKIPAENYLALGYANMIHKVDRTMNGLLNMGLIEQGEDGQWHANLSSDPAPNPSSAGMGLSKGMHGLLSTPLTFVETAANIGRWALSYIDDDFKGRADLSAWARDNYQLAIGSPIHINSHGIMGVNQFQFGLNPIPSAATAFALQKAPYVGDTQLVKGNTLAEVIEAMPGDIGVAEVLELNEDILREKWGPDVYRSLFLGGSLTPDFALLDTSDLAMQVPRSSWFDTVVDDVFFPFGRIDSTSGVIRQLVPSSVSFILRSTFGLWADEADWAEGILTLITGTTEQYQIDSEINRSILMLEAEEGLITKAAAISAQIKEILDLEGYDSIDAYFKAATPGSFQSQKVTDLSEDLEKMNDQIMKRATDRAMMSLLARGIMGFFGPASPRMSDIEQETLAEWYTTRTMAENARIRGDVDWSEIMREADVRDFGDIQRISGLVNSWYLDETGNETKAWFMKNYPNLMAFTQPVTFYGPAGAPPATRSLDGFFDDLKEGRRSPYPADVTIQRYSRTAVQASREGEFNQVVGSNDPMKQALWVLSNPEEARELKSKYRMKLKALDMWDDELNGNAYGEWRDRNQDEAFVFLEEAEEQLYIMQDVLDDVVGLSNIAELNPEDQEEFRKLSSQIMRAYRDGFIKLRDELTEENQYLVPREQILGQYYIQVADPYYEARTEVFDEMDNLETREEISVAWEQLRDIDNAHWGIEHTLTYEDETVVVPNVLERSWNTQSDEDRGHDILKWIARKPEWLSLYNTSKLTDVFPDVAPYLASTPQQVELYAQATSLRNEAIARARANPEDITQYERDQFTSKIDDWLRQELRNAGRADEATWLDAWPIERLAIAGQLPYSLGQISAWYQGIKADLDAQDPPKGPSSEYARRQFVDLGNYLEDVYYEDHPEAREAIDELGRVMFGSESRWVTYERLYGARGGELD
jgi:hypothetical protein